MTPHTTQGGPERPRPTPDRFHTAFNASAHQTMLKEAQERSTQLIDAHHVRGLTPAERAELPALLSKLRQCFATQMGREISERDMQNNAYDNAPIDNLLRQRIAQIRTMNIDLNYTWKTRGVRKFWGWLWEDMPNWFKVKPAEFWDGTKHFLVGAGVAAAGTAAAVAGGYMLAGALGGDGAMAGLGTLGRHAGVAWNTITGRGAPAPEMPPAA